MEEQDKGRKRKKAGLEKEVWSTKAELVIEFEEIDCLKMVRNRSHLGSGPVTIGHTTGRPYLGSGPVTI